MNILWFRTGWDSLSWQLMGEMLNMYTTEIEVCSYNIWERSLDLIKVGNSCPHAFMIRLLQRWNAGWVEEQKTGNREIKETT